MENEKLFELMEKIYVELQSTKAEMREGYANVNRRIDSVDKRIDSIEGEVRKNSITIESMDKRLKVMAEVQEVNCAENQKSHQQIVEMLTERLDIQDTAIKNNIKAVK